MICYKCREDRPGSAIPVGEENLAFYKSIGESISDAESAGDVTDAGSLAHSVEYSVNEKAVKSGQDFDESSNSQVSIGDDKVHSESEKDDENSSESTLEERTEL